MSKKKNKQQPQGGFGITDRDISMIHLLIEGAGRVMEHQRAVQREQREQRFVHDPTALKVTAAEYRGLLLAFRKACEDGIEITKNQRRNELHALGPEPKAATPEAPTPEAFEEARMRWQRAVHLIDTDTMHIVEKLEAQGKWASFKAEHIAADAAGTLLFSGHDLLELRMLVDGNPLDTVRAGVGMLRGQIAYGDYKVDK